MYICKKDCIFILENGSYRVTTLVKNYIKLIELLLILEMSLAYLIIPQSESNLNVLLF